MLFNYEFLGIRKATAWYDSHLKSTVVLMTEDAANREKAEKSGITSTSGLVSSFI
jgi:exosome complex exonuclease DIS3/RRP44